MSSYHSTTPAAQASARLYRTRQSHASRAVAAGTMAKDEALARLEPWAALACMVGADMPECVEQIVVIFAPDRRRIGFSETVRRSYTDYASAAEARATLARALTQALNQNSPELPDLAVLARALGVAPAWDNARTLPAAASGPGVEHRDSSTPITEQEKAA